MTLATATAIRALPSSPIVADGRLSSRNLAATANPYSISLAWHDSSHVRHSQGRQSLKFVFYCRKTAPNVVAMATGETPAEVATELPEFVTTLQEAWDRLDDKYAVASLAIVSLIALYGSVGMISAIDRLPVVPGLFELVGIGYTGAWSSFLSSSPISTLFHHVREHLVPHVPISERPIGLLYIENLMLS